MLFCMPLMRHCREPVAVTIRYPDESRRHGTEEEEMIPDDGAADRAAKLVVVIGLLGILEEADGLVVDRAEHETLDRLGAQ